MTRSASRDNLETVCAVLRSEAPQTDIEAGWPGKSMSAIAGAGLMSLTIPTEFGGAGAGMRETADVLRALSAACASTAMIYLMHVCGSQVIGAAAHRNALNRIVSENALTTLAFSETGSRSHFWAPVSRSEQNDKGTHITAEKSFVTSAGRADFYVTSVGSINRQSPIDSTLYLVEKGTPDVSVSGHWSGLGLRGNSSAPMTFNCIVGEGTRLTAEGAGFKAMMEIVLPWFQVGSAAVSIGIAQGAFAEAVRHTASARLEHIGDTLAASIPGIRTRLARMNLTLDSASAYLDRALGKIEKQAPDAMLSVLGVKAVAAEAAIEVTDQAMRACGGAAFGRQLSVERHFRDARAASVMAPTTDVLYDFIGKAIAGLPLF
jgi:alkylation response protein AidB-like acyl-CoA dehydrogenase